MVAPVRVATAPRREGCHGCLRTRATTPTRVTDLVGGHLVVRWPRRWPSSHAAALLLVAVALPAGSIVFGSGELAWTMFSKSETYRLAVTGVAQDGRKRPIDPRALAPLLDATAAYYLPAPGQWRHDAMGVTFRTGLPHLTALACRLGTYQRIEALLEERSHLDAAPVPTRANVRCRQWR